MRHGEKYTENNEEYMDDHINGATWHIPDRSEDIFDENGNWKDEV